MITHVQLPQQTPCLASCCCISVTHHVLWHLFQRQHVSDAIRDKHLSARFKSQSSVLFRTSYPRDHIQYQLARISCISMRFCTPHLVYWSTLFQPAANPRHYGHMTSCQFDMSDFCSATDQVHTLKAIKPEDLKLDIALLKRLCSGSPWKADQ